MGVYRAVREVVKEFEREGKLALVTEWRIAGAGGRDYVILIDPRSDRVIDYEVVSSTYGSHPYVIYGIDPDLKEVYVAKYERSNSGAHNVLKILRCRVERSREPVDEFGSNAVLRCEKLIEENIPREDILDEFVVARLGEEYVKMLKEHGLG